VKLATVILCSVLLVLGQVWQAPAGPAAACAKMSGMACCHNGMMSCCAAKTTTPAKPTAPAPLRGSVAGPLLFLLALGAAWQLVQWAVRHVSVYRLVPIYSRKSPLYARDCSRLI